MDSLEKFSDLQLIEELAKRNKTHVGPRCIAYSETVYETLIEDGPDNVIRILFNHDSPIIGHLRIEKEKNHD